VHNYGIPRNTTVEILSTWETANRTLKKRILIELHIPGFYHYFSWGGSKKDRYPAVRGHRGRGLSSPAVATAQKRLLEWCT
jgi:hypothetical protein